MPDFFVIVSSYVHGSSGWISCHAYAVGERSESAARGVDDN